MLGTLKEWLSHKPDACLTNSKILQEGVYISFFKFHEEPQKCVYPSRTPDFGEPVIHFGSSCFYMIEGEVKWTCMADHHFGGCGGSAVLSESQANDPNWEEFKF